MVVNLCRIVDPEVIVFGGGLSQAGEPLLSAIRKYVAQRTWKILPTDVKIVQACSENAGIVGAALAAQNLLSSTSTTPASPSPEANPRVEKAANGDGCGCWELGLGAAGIAMAALAGSQLMRSKKSCGNLHLGNLSLEVVVGIALVVRAWRSLSS